MFQNGHCSCREFSIKKIYVFKADFLNTILLYTWPPCCWLYWEAFESSFEYGMVLMDVLYVLKLDPKQVSMLKWILINSYQCSVNANFVLLRENFALLMLNMALLKFMVCVLGFQIRFYLHAHVSIVWRSANKSIPLNNGNIFLDFSIYRK